MSERRELNETQQTSSSSFSSSSTSSSSAEYFARFLQGSTAHTAAAATAFPGQTSGGVRRSSSSQPIAPPLWDAPAREPLAVEGGPRPSQWLPGVRPSLPSDSDRLARRPDAGDVAPHPPYGLSSSLASSQPASAPVGTVSIGVGSTHHHQAAPQPPPTFHPPPAPVGGPLQSYRVAAGSSPSMPSVTLAAALRDGESPPLSAAVGSWYSAPQSLPYTAALSRSASSSLPLSATTAAAARPPSAPHHTPSPPIGKRRSVLPLSAVSSPRFGGPHSSPITSPVLPGYHAGHSLLPPSTPLSTTSSGASSGASSGGSSSTHPPVVPAHSALPPFHPSPPSSLPSVATASPPSSTSSFSSSPSFGLQHHIPSCSISLDGQLQDANAAFLSTFALPSPSAATSIYSVIHPSEHLSFMIMMRRIITGKTRSLANEAICHVGGGRVQRMWVMMSAVTLDERLMTLYCCFLPKPRREEREEEERERAELRLELEGRAQLQAAHMELQEELLRIERTYQQQFATLTQQQHKYGITQAMIDHYSTHANSAAVAASPASAPPTALPRDPAQLSLSGLPKPQQLQLHALHQTNHELKQMQAQHTAKLIHFIHLLARHAPFQAVLGASSSVLGGEGNRAHTAPGGLSGWEGGGTDEDADFKMAYASSPSDASARGGRSAGRLFSASAATTQDSPSPFSSSDASTSGRASSAALSSASTSSLM